MKLIPLDAVLAEIEKLQLCTMDEHMNYYSAEAQGEYNALSKLESFIDTLEVKEGDLDFMLHEYWDISPKICVDCLESATMTKDEMINFAKHFFELGVNASNPLTWEDISVIRQTMADYRREENHERNNEDFCKEVLKRFKAQKGEDV